MVFIRTVSAHVCYNKLTNILVRWNYINARMHLILKAPFEIRYCYKESTVSGTQRWIEWPVQYFAQSKGWVWKKSTKSSVGSAFLLLCFSVRFVVLSSTPISWTEWRKQISLEWKKQENINLGEEEPVYNHRRKNIRGKNIPEHAQLRWTQEGEDNRHV